MNRHARTAAVLSVLSMGLGQFYNRQWVKGLLFLTIHLIGLYFIVTIIYQRIRGLITLGDQGQHLELVGKVYKNVSGDHSIFIMIFGVIAVLVLAVYLVIYLLNVRDAWYNGRSRDEGKSPLGFRATIHNSFSHGFPWLMLAVPIIGVLFFTIMPIVLSIAIAFTNYSSPEHIPPKNLVDWVGLKTFRDLFLLDIWSHTFVGVFTWTLVWAISSTATCYFGGLLVALLINQKGVKFKTFWRTIFIIPYAIPQFVSLLIMRNILNDKFGPLNQYFRYFGLQGLPWISDPFWAKVSLIAVNMWIGIPVTMVLALGVLTTIPNDLYEAAEIDGASAFLKFRHITIPHVLFATAPILITQFAGNINNFNVIYLLTKGLPANGNYHYAGSTDLLVTWLYKLTLDNNKYNIACAIGIAIFVILASLSILTYRRTRSYREEDLIQ